MARPRRRISPTPLALAAAATLLAAPPTSAEVRVVGPDAVCTVATHDHQRDAGPDALMFEQARQAIARLDLQRPRVPVAVGAPRGAGGLDIQFNVSEELAARTGFVEALNRAAETWETRLADPVRVIIIVDEADPQDTFIAAASSVSVPVPWSLLRPGLIADAAPGPEAPLIAALPEGPVPIAEGTQTDTTDLVVANSANLKALGLVNSDNLPIDIDAYVVFNVDDFFFDVNPDDGVSPGAVDLLFVLVHEVGHVLGFTSQTDRNTDFSTTASVLDLFRFGLFPPSNPETIADYTTTPRQIGNAVEATLDTVGFFGPDNPPFSSGVFGDGRQASHWKDDVILDIVPAIGVMDPTYDAPLGPGQGAVEGYLTDADLLAMRMIGWEIVEQNPCPADLTGDGLVSGADLAAILGSWTQTDPALNLDDVPGVGPGDLAIVLAAWGPCPN